MWNWRYSRSVLAQRIGSSASAWNSASLLYSLNPSPSDSLKRSLTPHPQSPPIIWITFLGVCTFVRVCREASSWSCYWLFRRTSGLVFWRDCSSFDIKARRSCTYRWCFASNQNTRSRSYRCSRLCWWNRGLFLWVGWRRLLRDRWTVFGPRGRDLMLIQWRRRPWYSYCLCIN